MKKNNNVIIFIVLVLAFGTILYLAANRSTPSPLSKSNPTIEQTKIFQSSNTMKFSIALPVTYSVEEKFGKVTVLTPSGEIYINQIGTNYDNLEDFLQNVKERNKFSIKEERKLIINDLPAMLWEKTDERLYMLYRENTVYTISTKPKSLYDNLDKIAKSFRYTPDSKSN